MEIALLISCFLWFGIGYALGSLRGSHMTIEAVKEKAHDIIKGKTPLGPIMRPTAQQVNKHQDTQQQQEEEEMERNLKLMFPQYLEYDKNKVN